MQTLGDKFKLAREKRKVTASQAAAATHMMVQHVEAMESNQFQKFAAPTYAKGFIKLYAEYLGLEPAPLIREYVDRHMPKQRPRIMPDETPAPQAAKAKASPVPEPAVESAAPSFSIPKLELGRRFSAVAGKISSLFSAAARRVPKISWKHPALAAGVIVLALLVMRVVQMSGREAGESGVARPAHRADSMSLIIQDPPDPYLEIKGDKP